MLKEVRFFLITLLPIQIACAMNPVAKDRDYRPAEISYDEGDPKEALRVFPSRESGGFITSVEKSWLEFWSEDWNDRRLKGLRDTLDVRQYISVSRELGYFLWQESPDGYVPSEHELVILNLVRAQHFLQREKFEEAKVELRQAQYVLERHWDDRALRIWLGSLWTAAGEWPEAQVDFRNANIPLAEAAPPKQIYLHFKGVGPELNWHEGKYEPEFVEDQPEELKELDSRFSTLPWFHRHLQRNSGLRDLMIRSNYQSQYLGAGALTAVENGINRTAEWTVKTTGVLLGSAIVAGGYYLVFASPGLGSGGAELLSLPISAGLGVAAGFWKLGENMRTEGLTTIQKDYESRMDSLKIYRCIRFMPTWLALSTQHSASSPIQKQIRIKSKGATEVILVNHY